MTNGDYIREMNNDRLCRFLWTWGINYLASFFEHGGQKLMDAQTLRQWLDSEEGFICEETMVGKDFVYDQEFNLKEMSDNA